MKGIVLRSLRWWIAQPIFTTDGLLSIGYSYPSLLVADNYNAPGSPYWGLKVFLMLSLSEDHPFWKNEESPLPALERTKLLKMPRSIAQRTESGDVVLLNAGQYPTFDMNHAAEKYAKFAYSATYGFSCSLSNYGFPNLGCDNMLFLVRETDIGGNEGRSGMSYSPIPWYGVRGIRMPMFPSLRGSFRSKTGISPYTGLKRLAHWRRKKEDSRFCITKGRKWNRRWNCSPTECNCRGSQHHQGPYGPTDL